jgi:cell division protease FtsH
MSKKPSTPPDSQRPVKPRTRRRLVPSVGWIITLVLLAALVLSSRWFSQQRSTIDYSFFHEQLSAHNIESVQIEGQRIYGQFAQPPLASSVVNGQTTARAEPGAEPAPAGLLDKQFLVVLPNPTVSPEQLQEMRDAGVRIEGRQPNDWGQVLVLVWLGLLAVLVFGGWNMARRTRDQLFGGGMLSGVLRSPARRYSADGPRTTFNDVAGLVGVKRDLQEVVDYLRDPARFQRLGARVPKGVLLMGPPGTGKTLLAKAVAGEAGVPFFSINGSEFIQLFVGVGAGRVRDMFQTAQAAAPAILFIDEIDAVGRQRGAGLGGGHDEREQTLNQILSEMDGFSPTSTVIVLAATNRPDVLDPALLRPGRFDRHITVDRPTLAGRRELLEVHTRGIPLSDDVDFDRLARGTVGLTGADIRNLANEAALWATRHDSGVVRMDDFEFARDKVLMGSAREDVLTDKEKRVTAYHEAGHTILAWLTPGCDRVHKVTIIPRGRALGVTQLVPDEDRYNVTQPDLEARLAMLLGGRAAEKIHFDHFSAGAENDLEEATRLARRMVTHWGMSKRLGPVAYHMSEDHPFLGREIAQHQRQFSEHTAQVIDEEVAKILNTAEDHAQRTLQQHAQQLDKLAGALCECESLDEQEVAKLIGPSVQQMADHSRSAGPSRVASMRE